MIYKKSSSREILKGAAAPEPRKRWDLGPGSKRENRFSGPSFWYGTKYLFVLASPPRLSNFWKGPRDMQKFLQKYQKTAGCWVCTVYGSQLWITSKPGSSPLDRPGLNYITSQPWSHTTCPCTNASSAYFRFVNSLFQSCLKNKTNY